MCRPDYMKQIEDRITNAPAGTAFITSDFLDVADTLTISKALSRLSEKGKSAESSAESMTAQGSAICFKNTRLQVWSR